ncbi:nucleoside 2-deoxyribosyltransferase [Acidocella sp.]|uniref:nucleoside 2-deoxyribosyltransferase n=1 Tax=Acidocella sp. TaxID=50710 RepID=UPI00262E34ED|nr:nucleoside 2-deoxyribosyltransferase [Acidocella sp.]
MLKAYLAGPDVFLPHAAAQAEAKIALCAKYGLTGIAPFNPDLDLSLPPARLWRRIFADDVRMMRDCDIIIANLTPFRGASADAGTLVELGWFLGMARPAYGYSNSAEGFATRTRAHRALVPDPMAGLEIEDFGLADNLMIEGALAGGIVLPPDGFSRAFESLEVFERCLASVGSRA